MTRVWTQISFKVPASLADDISESLLEFCPGGVVTDNLTLDTFSLEGLDTRESATVTVFVDADDTGEAQIEELTSLVADFVKKRTGKTVDGPEVTSVGEEDWSNSWKENFKTSRVGKHLVIKPTWESISPDSDDIVIEMDPGMAFGTGTHSTTRLCLQALEDLLSGSSVPKESSGTQKVLDVGTGSGILAIAAAKLGFDEIMAVDIDIQAVETALKNIFLNGVDRVVSVSTLPLSQISGTFHIVVANILAEDLVKMGTDLIARTEEGGLLILSGILNEKEDLVSEGYAQLPVRLLDLRRDEDWSCFIYQRNRGRCGAS